MRLVDYLEIEELKKIFEEVKRCQDADEFCKWGASLNAKLGDIGVLVAYYWYYLGYPFEKIFNHEIGDKLKRDLIGDTSTFDRCYFDDSIPNSFATKLSKFRMFLQTPVNKDLKSFEEKIPLDDSYITEVKLLSEGSCLPSNWHSDKYVNFIEFQKWMSYSDNKVQKDLDFTLYTLLEVMFLSSPYDICLPKGEFETFLSDKWFKDTSVSSDNIPSIFDVISEYTDTIRFLIDGIRYRMTNKLVFDVVDIMNVKDGYHLNSLNIKDIEVVEKLKKVTTCSESDCQTEINSRKNSLEAFITVLSYVLDDSLKKNKSLILIMSSKDYVDITSYFLMTDWFKERVESKIVEVITYEDMVGGHAIIMDENCLQIEQHVYGGNINDIKSVQKKFIFRMPINPSGIRIQMIGYNAYSPFFDSILNRKYIKIT